MNAIFAIIGLIISLILGIITLPFRLLYGLFSTEVHHHKTGLSRSEAFDDLVHEAERKEIYSGKTVSNSLIDYGIFSSSDIGKWGLWNKKENKFMLTKSHDKNKTKQLIKDFFTKAIELEQGVFKQIEDNFTKLYQFSWVVLS